MFGTDYRSGGRGLRVPGRRVGWRSAAVAVGAVAVFTIGLRHVRSGPAPTTTPARSRTVKPLRIDRARRQVVIQAKVSLRRGFLEFLLCTEGTKDYESLLTTKVPPSSLHAALLALGLAPGLPARWTTPAGSKPVFSPPKGAMLEITLRWKDARGRTHTAAATDWLLAAGTKRKPPATRWVFVGSDFLDDGRYWADVEGHHISLANFASSVVDVPFESSDKQAFLEFAANPQTVPAKGTAVEVVLRAVKGAETAPAARMSFEVDAFGRIALEGRAVAPEAIAPAVRKFLARHAEAAADVRIDPRALVFDRERLKSILTQAGLTDVTFRMRELRGEVLPRTSAQVARSIKWWKHQFAQTGDLIVDPVEDAAAVLKHVEKRRKEVEALSRLWSDYAAQLRTLVQEWRARRQSAPAEEK